MIHNHEIYDDDKHFTINIETRELEIDGKDKMTIMQGDHDSERITFDIRKTIEGHNVLDCNAVEVHFLNIEDKTQMQIADLYTVEDLCESKESEDMVTFSWLISENATQLIGKICFRVTFKCVAEKGEVTYRWSTAIFDKLYVGKGISNTSYIVERDPDVIAQIEARLDAIEQAGGAGYTLPVATAEQLGGVKAVAATEEMTEEVGIDADGKLKVKPGGSGGTVEVDTTLSQSGKAADAKAVGDALKNVGNPTDEQVASAVQTYLTEHPEATTTVQDGSVTPNKTTFLKQYRKNLLDLTACESGQIEYNGTIVENANVWVSGFIPADKAVYYSSLSIQFCGLYLNGSFVTRFNVYGTTLDMTSRTEEFDSIRLSTNTGGTAVTDKEWMFAEGALPTTFIPYDSAENLVLEIVDDSLTKIIEDTASQAVNEVVTPVATGLTEELHDDAMIPYDWTQYELRDVTNYNAHMVYVPNNAVVAYDGRAHKISFSGGGGDNGTLKHGEMAMLFHFRPVDGTYTEIGRYKFFANAKANHEYDLDFEVKAGDLFGVNTVIGTASVNMKNKEHKVTYTDDAVSFTQADLDAGSNPYCARLFTVYISGTRNTAGKAQLAAEDGSMSILRKADIETAPLKNMLNPQCIYSGVLGGDGTVTSSAQAKWALIKVEPNTAYSYNRRDASKWITENNKYNAVCFYDENMVFLSSVTEDLLPFTPEMGKTVVTPDNCAYVAVTILNYGGSAGYDASDVMQFERGTHNTQYEPYGKYVSSIKGIPLFRYIQKEVQEYDVPVNAIFMGDSIASSGLGKWWTHMLAKYSFKSARNIGIGGMCWTHTANTVEDISFDLANQGGPTSADSNVLTNAVNLLIDGVNNQGWTKPDVVFIYCGINDRGMALDGETGLNYGDPEAAFEYTDDYSNLAYGDEKLQNLCGAFRFAMEKLYRAFPYVKVVVCTPMYTGNNSNKKVRALNKTIKECASWMGIPVFDLGYESYVYQKFEENGVTEKYLEDALHPNEKGGKLLADLIAHHLIARFGGKEFYDLSE